jgi:hypothetical protein
MPRVTGRSKLETLLPVLNAEDPETIELKLVKYSRKSIRTNFLCYTNLAFHGNKDSKPCKLSSDILIFITKFSFKKIPAMLYFFKNPKNGNLV